MTNTDVWSSITLGGAALMTAVLALYVVKKLSERSRRSTEAPKPAPASREVSISDINWDRLRSMSSDIGRDHIRRRGHSRGAN